MRVKQIFINARFLTQSVTGVQRYAREVVRALDDLIGWGAIDSTKYRFEMLAPREAYDDLRLKHIPLTKVGFLTGHAWEQGELPFYSSGGLLVNLCNTGPLLKARQVVTIHDTAVYGFPQAFSFAFRTWYKILLRSLGRMAGRIITVSSFSKQELTRYCPVGTGKIHVVYEGKEHIFATEPDLSIMSKHNIEPANYILAVSSMSPSKNFASIVRAIETIGRSDFDVVIAGGVNPRVFKSAGKSLPESVKHVGYVTDNELRALYEQAACFVFPSFYEGFGLPPLEAMACGCPVVVSDAASLPEVCGEAALYCNPYNPADIAAKIQLIMNDADLRESLRQKGLVRAREFTWEKCARETFEVVRQVLESQ